MKLIYPIISALALGNSLACKGPNHATGSKCLMGSGLDVDCHDQAWDKCGGGKPKRVAACFKLNFGGMVCKPGQTAPVAAAAAPSTRGGRKKGGKKPSKGAAGSRGLAGSKGKKRQRGPKPASAPAAVVNTKELAPTYHGGAGGSTKPADVGGKPEHPRGPKPAEADDKRGPKPSGMPSRPKWNDAADAEIKQVLNDFAVGEAYVSKILLECIEYKKAFMTSGKDMASVNAKEMEACRTAFTSFREDFPDFAEKIKAIKMKHGIERPSRGEHGGKGPAGGQGGRPGGRPEGGRPGGEGGRPGGYGGRPSGQGGYSDASLTLKKDYAEIYNAHREKMQKPNLDDKESKLKAEISKIYGQIKESHGGEAAKKVAGKIYGQVKEKYGEEAAKKVAGKVKKARGKGGKKSKGGKKGGKRGKKPMAAMSEAGGMSRSFAPAGGSDTVKKAILNEMLDFYQARPFYSKLLSNMEKDLTKIGNSFGSDALDRFFSVSGLGVEHMNQWKQLKSLN